MRVAIDHERCIASGMCTSLAPTVFALGDDGRLVLLHDADLAPEEADPVRNAVACCPVEALVLEEG